LHLLRICEHIRYGHHPSEKLQQNKYKLVNFDVLLTVHLSMILVINQLNAQILVL